MGCEQSPRAWERCVAVSCVPIFLSLLLSVAHLTDKNVRPSHPHNHPQDNHLDHPDHRCNNCCHQDHHGSRREQQGWGLGGLVGMGMRRGAGAGGAREWGTGDMLRAGWGRGEVFFPCLSAPCTDRQANCRSSVSFDTSTYPGDCDHAHTTMHSSCFIIQNKGTLGVYRAGLRCFSAPYT